MVELVKRLDRQVFEPAVFCLGPRGELAGVLENAGVPVFCLGAKRSWQVGVIFRLIRALRRFRPVILQTWLYHANILGRLAAPLVGGPVVVSGIRVAEKRSRCRLWIDRLTQSLADAHVCVSRAVADFSIQEGGLNPNRVHVIPNGVDFIRFAKAEPAGRDSLDIPRDSKVILFVGRLDPQKDPLFMLKVFERIASQTDDVHLVMVGEGVLEAQVNSQIRRSAFANRAHRFGWRDDIPELLKTSDVLVLPSRWEGMPNVVLEAAASGTPVVASAAEGIAEILTDRVTGRILASRNPDEMAEAVMALLGNPEGAAKLGQSAQSHVSKHFTLEETSKKYQELYRELTGTVHRNWREGSSD